MEKSSKLTINSLSLRNINFGGFSTSNKWVGCFEKKERFCFSLIESAIKTSEDFFGDEWNNFFALSALSYDDEASPLRGMPEEYNVIYNRAKEKGYLNPDDDDFGSYLYGDTPLPAASLSIHFDSSDFLDMSRLVMGHVGVVGQVLFFINLTLGVAIYPHEDIGFGAISLNGDDDVCKKFIYGVDEVKFNIID